MEDSFYIGIYWGSRAESLVEVAGKTLQTLKKLSEVDEQFFNWYEKGVGRKQALENNVSIEAHNIENLYRKAVKKHELLVDGFAKNGFYLGLWTGQRDDESSGITFNVGDAFTIPTLSNSVVLKMPFEGSAKERLLKSETVKTIISILVEVWKPDYGSLVSTDLREKLKVGNEIGWITYRRSIKHIPNLSSQIIYEKLSGGHLFTIASFTYDNSVDELEEIKSFITGNE